MAAAEKLAAARASIRSSSDEGNTSDSSASRGSSRCRKCVGVALHNTLACLTAAQAGEGTDKKNIRSCPKTGSAHEGNLSVRSGLVCVR